MVRVDRRVPAAGILSADKLEDYLELQEPGLESQIRKSSQEYSRGKTRSAATFLTDLRREFTKPKK
jgi:hypothetical protein